MPGAGRGRAAFPGGGGRLDELTRIKNDFEDELRQQPTPGQGGGRREQLSRDHSDVMQAQQDEVLRLMHGGMTPDEISRHLDQTDPSREAQQEPEAGE